LLPALIGFAAASPAHACVQVDHVDDLALIREALALGAGAVMADGSRLTLAENVAFVREAVRLAASFGAGIEGELGRIEGDEDVAVAAREGRLTDPAQVDEFVRASGAACLAVSIGNAHGRYARPPALDWERLDAIAAATLVPLALHGVSGLPDDVVHTAIRHHVVKVNVNTELREAYLSASEVALPAARVEANLLALHDAQVRAVEKVVDGKLRLCAGSSDSKPRRL
jgi:ketose-bisphosphate aldolase